MGVGIAKDMSRIIPLLFASRNFGYFRYFKEIVDHIRRTPEHLQKFLLKELAAKGNMEGDRLVLNSKISSKKINPKIEQYVEEFVICKECRKPDTEIMKDGKMSVLHCLACGAKHPIRAKI